MNCIIENNSFSMDTRNLRLTRLSLLSKHLIQYSEELTLEKDTIDWATNSYYKFKELLSQQNTDLEEKAKAYSLLQQADNELYEKYVVLKELLLTRYENNINLYNEYGINGPIPSNRDERYEKAMLLIKTHNNLLNNNDNNLLPQEMIDKLNFLSKNAKNHYQNVNKLKNKSQKSTKVVNQKFDNDSIRIRKLYNWIAANWGKKDARMLAFGFSLPKSISNTKKTPTIFQMKVDKKSKIISWHSNSEKKLEPNIDNKTHQTNNNNSVYQLAYKDKITNSEWLEIYSGTEIKNLDLNNSGIYKVRARNTNGYGPWSPEIKL